MFFSPFNRNEAIAATLFYLSPTCDLIHWPRHPISFIRIFFLLLSLSLVHLPTAYTYTQTYTHFDFSFLPFPTQSNPIL